MPAFLALPRSTPGPAVLVISDAMGRSPFYEHLACMLADAGFVACTPDYFFRVAPLRDQQPETRRARRKDELDEQQVLHDLQATMRWLSQLPEVRGSRVGVVGFCMGGTLALDMAAAEPAPAASVAFYGYLTGEPGKALVPPPRPVDVAHQMRAPLLAFWGDQDPGYDAKSLAEFRRRLDAAGASGSFHVFPGVGHGFLREFLEDEASPGYAVAAEAWQRTIDFLREHLAVRGPTSGADHAASDGLSIARLLDDARQRLVEAWDRDEQPQHLLVNPRLYDLVAQQKAREVQRGRPLRVLGLLLVSSAETAAGSPEVR
jgi:carboxymethylenebutenolidase